MSDSERRDVSPSPSPSGPESSPGLPRRGFLAGSLAGSTLVGVGCGRSIEAAPGAPAPRAPRVDDFESVRGLFALDREHVHMAGLLLASHPTPVREAIARHRDGLDRNPVLYLENNAGRLESAVRASAARYLEADAGEIALTDSTTMGLATLYNGIVIRRDQDILTTEHDHYSTHESLRLMSQKTGAPVRKIALFEDSATASAEDITARIGRAITPATRVVAVTYVHSSTGMKLPIPDIARVVADKNRGRSPADRAVLCVDGVHGFGVENITAAGLGCDFFVAGTHKWLFGPRGTGIIWGKKQAWEAAAPTIPAFNIEGLLAVRAGEPQPQLPFGKIMTPGGFHSFEHRWAVTEAFELHLSLGKQKVQDAIHARATRLKQALATMKHVRLYTPMSPKLSAGIVCFDVDGMRPGQVVKRLHDQNIIISQTPYARTHARATPALFNSVEDVDRVAQAIRGLG